MYPPIFYGLASIIPGLGHLLLGLPRRAMNAIFVVSLPAIAYMVVTRQNDKYLLLFLLVVAWILQMIGAYDTAKAYNEISRENPMFGKQGELIRSALVTKKVISQLIKTDEVIDAAIYGMHMVARRSGITIQFPMGLRYLALTKDNVIVVDINILGKPSKIRRIPRKAVKHTRYRKGLLSDQLLIEVAEDASVNLRVGSYFRDEAEKFTKLSRE
jgi:hypothetical protein